MSYNLVKKGDTAVLVEKFRDEKGKVREKYLDSCGSMTDREFINFRTRFNEYSQDRRCEAFAQSKRGLVQTPSTEVRYPKVEKILRTKKEKKAKKVTKRYYPGITYAPMTFKTHTEIMREREIEKREIAASKPKPIQIPGHIKSKGKKIAFLNNLQLEYRKDIKECRKGVREEEIKMAPSLYAQRKEKTVIARYNSEIKAVERIIERIDKQKEGLR